MHAYTRALVVGLQIAYIHMDGASARCGWARNSIREGKARQGKPNRPSHASQPVRRNVAGSQGQTQGRILEGEGKVLGGSIIITVGLDWIGMTGVCENFRQQHELVIMTVWKHWDLLIYCLRVRTTKRREESFNGCSSSCRIR
jgi:hypothetical protein